LQNSTARPIPPATAAHSLLNDGSVTAVVIFPDVIRGSPFHSTNNNECQQARPDDAVFTTQAAGASKRQAGHGRMAIA
jgi:hypothetical protein